MAASRRPALHAGRPYLLAIVRVAFVPTYIMPALGDRAASTVLPAVATRYEATTSGVANGWPSRNSATAPLTYPAAIEVPVQSWVVACRAMSMLGSSTESPGAKTSMQGP